MDRTNVCPAAQNRTFCRSALDGNPSAQQRSVDRLIFIRVIDDRAIGRKGVAANGIGRRDGVENDRELADGSSSATTRLLMSLFSATPLPCASLKTRCDRERPPSIGASVV
jgi:hypothetical protein